MQFRKPPVLTPGRPSQSSLPRAAFPRPVAGRGGASLPVSSRPQGCGAVRVGGSWGRQKRTLPSSRASVSAGLPAGPARVGGLGREGRPLTEEGRAWEDRRSTLVLLWGCVILLEAIKETDVHFFFFRKQIMALRPIGRKFEQVS